MKEKRKEQDVYIISWALSSGIVMAKGYHHPNGYQLSGRSFPCWVILDPWAQYDRVKGEAHCFGTLEEAKANVEKRIKKRIESLREQIRKLQALEPEIIDARGLERLP